MLLSYAAPFKEDYNDRRLHFYERGESIPLDKEGFWQIYRGVAQISQISERGDDILLGWLQSGHFFGLSLTYLDTYEVTSLSEVYLKWYTAAEIENSEQLTRALLEQVINRHKQTESLLAIAGIKRVEERLHQLLKLLKRELGQPLGVGSRLNVRLTHQNIANAIGTTRVTITRLLGDFQRQGRIDFDDDRHLIIY